MRKPSRFVFLGLLFLLVGCNARAREFSTCKTWNKVLEGKDVRYAPLIRVADPGTAAAPVYTGFWFYDVLQFDASGRYALAMKVYFQGRNVTPADRADIGYIDLQDNFKWTKFGETTAWNWQQGCRLQWRPGSQEIIWNDRADDGSHFLSRTYDFKTGARRTLPRPIYDISRDGKFALMHEFQRMKHPGTEYVGIADRHEDQRAPAESGVEKMDLDTGHVQFLVSLERIAALAFPKGYPGKSSLYVFREGWNPSGTRFITFLRDADPRAYVSAWSISADGRDIRFFYNFPSHHAWLDDTTLLEGHRFTSFKDDGTGKPFQKLAEVGDANFDPTILPGGEWILGDTYVINGHQHLFLFHRPTGLFVPLAKLPSTAPAKGIHRVDLHARARRDGRTVCIDATHEGLGRQMYIISIGHILDNPPIAGTLSATDVPYSRLRAAADEPGSWLTYSGTYSGQRYSKLAQLHAGNVAGLRPVWIYQLQRAGTFECTPIVADEVMYVVEPPSTVTALDLRTGRRFWSWSPNLAPDQKTIGYPRTNRGVAILGDKVFVATIDAHLVALDAKTGVKRWDVTVADYATGHGMTLAPLAIEGKIIVGISGAETGIRGFVDAYAVDTGKLLWRFWTVPADGEPGRETWQAESWKTGGGSTWLTGACDPELNLIYWGVGNPAPDWNGDERQGDNLYTCSLVALEADTGKLRWHFQFTPHDTHDWDANQIPVLVDAEFRGRMRKLVVSPNRNAFYYVIDRTTGEFLTGKEFAKQTWAKGLDEKGRPMVLPNTDPTEAGTLVWPSLQGAVNWYSPSYSPLTGYVYAAVREMGAIYYKTDAEYTSGAAFYGGGEQSLKGDQASGAVRALELTTGELKWEFPLHSPPWAGTMSTAGGLVFGGCNEGNFFALEQRSRKLLWEFQTGGPIRSNPISILIGGKQCVAIASHNALFVFGLEAVNGRLELTSQQ